MIRYSSAEKQIIIDYSSKHSIRAASIHFKIASNTIKRWINPEFKEKQYKKNGIANKIRWEQDPEFRNKYNEITKAYQRNRRIKDIEWAKQCSKNAYKYTLNRIKIDDDYYKRYKKIHLKARHKRRASELNLNENFSIQEREDVYNRFDHKCAICNSQKNLTIDHWIPITKGHVLSKTNAVLMCKSCNSAKRDKHPHNIYNKDIINKIENILCIV